MTAGVAEAARAVRPFVGPADHFAPILLFWIECQNRRELFFLFGKPKVEIKLLVHRKWIHAFEDGMRWRRRDHLKLLRLNFRKPSVWPIARFEIEIAAHPIEEFLAGLLTWHNQAVVKEHHAGTTLHDLPEILHAPQQKWVVRLFFVRAIRI